MNDGGYRDASQPREEIPRDVAECRACHARVQFSSTGKCPACQASFHETKDDGRRQLKLKADTRLPDVCAECGESTDRRATVDRTRALEEGGGSKLVRYMLFGWAALLFAWMRPKDLFVVEIPICRGCPTPEPQHVDFVHRVMTFHVHRALHDAAG